MTRITDIKAFGLIFCLCAWGGFDCARASVFVHTVNLPAQGADWNNSSVLLPQYDSINGALARVTIRLAGSISGQVGVENLDDKFNLIYATLGGRLVLLDAGNSTVLTLNLSQTGDTVRDSFDGDLDYAGASGYTFSTLMASGSIFAQYVDGVDNLSGFVGLGTLQYGISLSDISDATAGFGIPSFFSQVNGGATLEITYETAVLPEPGSLSLMGIALGLVLGVRKWNRRNAEGSWTQAMHRRRRQQ